MVASLLRIFNSAKTTILLLPYFFTVSAVDPTCNFKLRDLKKLEAGTDVFMYRQLRDPFRLKEELGLRNLSPREAVYFKANHGDADRHEIFFIRWINNHSSVKPTWRNLIDFLEKFDEEKVAHKLKLYLTSVPEHIVAKNTAESKLPVHNIMAGPSSIGLYYNHSVGLLPHAC